MSPLSVEEMYRRHAPVVLRRARHLLKDDAEAQEVLQEVFLRLLDKPNSFRGDSSPITYLYSATTNHCLNQIRNHRKRTSLLAQHGASDAAQPALVEHKILARETLAALPDKLAKVAVHYYLDEMNQEEIASIVGVSRRMVGKYLARLHDLSNTEQPQ